MKLDKFIAFGMAMILGIMASCSKDPAPTPDPSPESYFEKEGLVPHFGSDQFPDKIITLGGLKAIDLPWVRARAGKNLTTDINEAKIVIIGNSLIDANKELLASAYKDGKFIIVCYPDVNKLRSIREEMGWVFIIPDNVPDSDFAIGFAARHTFLQTPPVKGNSEVIQVSDYKEEIDMDNAEYENSSVFCSVKGLIHFIQQYKKHLSQGTKTSVEAPDLNATINTNFYGRSFSSNLNAHISGAGRYLKAFYGFAFDMEIYPCYIPQDVHNHGDYYRVKATATNFAPTMYEYEDKGEETDPDKACGSHPYPHYWPYESGVKEKSYYGDAYFLGPYNTMFNFRCYASKNEKSLKFIERPTPESSISTTSYNQSSTKSWDVGVSGGYSQKNGANVNVNLGFGGSSTNSVSYSMSDMQVLNRSTDNKVEYEFDYQNVPLEPVNIDDYLDYSRMPAISRSTALFEMMWEWTLSTPKDDYDSSIQGIDVELIHQIVIMTRDKHSGIWYNYWNAYAHQIFYRDPGCDSPMKVGRIPTGCLHIDNKCTGGQMLYNICVVDETGATVATSENNIAQGEFYEVLLPQKNHTYSVYFDMGKSYSDTKQYHSIKTVQLPLLINTEDKKVLTATDLGGDFETDVALIRVKNQSQFKLVRNITVYRAADNTPIATYPSSISYNESAEINVNAGVEYYVTMEFGSSSNFDMYRSASNFTPSPYHSEGDAKVLIATITGGDFVKM